VPTGQRWFWQQRFILLATSLGGCNSSCPRGCCFLLLLLLWLLLQLPHFAAVTSCVSVVANVSVQQGTTEASDQKSVAERKLLLLPTQL